MERLTAHFDGHVQGVGFRYSTLRIANDLDVTGFVVNLPDGRVKLVAEGDADELSTLQHRVEDAMRGYIRDVSTVRESATGEFREFVVKH